MPIIKGSASEFTTLARVNATQTTDPEKKSRTFVAPNKMVIAPIVRAADTSMMPLSQVVTFAFTGGSQRFDIPAQVTSILVTLLGAGGASHGGGSYVNGGSGGYVSGRLPVNPGETLDIVVGGGGVGKVGGYGGGGSGNDATGGNTPGGGGGRTAIIRSGNDIVTAGGGGGAGRGVSGRSGIGGAGGGAVGQDSQKASGFPGDSAVSLGKGGTQTSGGAGGADGGSTGSKYQGGNGATGVYTGLGLSNSALGSMTITGTIPAITNGSTSGFNVVISGSSNTNLNGTFAVVSWAANSVVVTTGYNTLVTGITGATMTAAQDTGGGGGGWYGGGGGGNTFGQTGGGGGGGGSSYVALLDQTYPIVNTQGGGAAGGTDPGGAHPQVAGGNGSCIIQYTVIPGYHNWKSLPFNGRIYIT